MKLQSEDVRSGWYVVVMDDKRGFPDEVWPRPTMSGHPYRVLRVELPFCVMQDVTGGVEALDLRDFTLRRVSLRYWRCFTDHSAPVYRRCPRCGSRLSSQVPSCPYCGDGQEAAAL